MKLLLVRYQYWINSNVAKSRLSLTWWHRKMLWVLIIFESLQHRFLFVFLFRLKTSIIKSTLVLVQLHISCLFNIECDSVITFACTCFFACTCVLPVLVSVFGVASGGIRTAAGDAGRHGRCLHASVPRELHRAVCQPELRRRGGLHHSRGDPNAMSPRLHLAAGPGQLEGIQYHWKGHGLCQLFGTGI